MTPRPAARDDAAAIAEIYNQGIGERTASFETRPRADDEILAWLDVRHPVIVVEEGDQVIGFAASFPYRPGRECYAGVAEFAVYVDRTARRRGAGRLAMRSLLASAEEAGLWKLLSVSSSRTAPAASCCAVSASARWASIAAMPGSPASGGTS